MSYRIKIRRSTKIGDRTYMTESFSLGTWILNEVIKKIFVILIWPVAMFFAAMWWIIKNTIRLPFILIGKIFRRK
jgi:hypothetical protein